MNTKLVRIQRDIEELAKFNATPERGLTRFSFTKEDRGAREYIKSEMIKAGLAVYEDAAGTVVGRLEGMISDAPVVMVGSHYDSVKNGGNFDGSAGVVTGLEIARVLKENNLKPKHPIEFIAMIEEEGGRFGGGLFASRAMVGLVSLEQMNSFKDQQGISLGEAMDSFGFRADRIKDAIRKPEELKCFVELHIEQGPILEANKKDIGIVEYIVGIQEFEVIMEGRPDHAGTTPMEMRADALDGASNVIGKISGFAKEVGEGTVATVGKLQVIPGAANIIPGEVRFTVDIRSKYAKCIENVRKEINHELEEITHKKGIHHTIREMLYVKPVKLSTEITKHLSASCRELGMTEERIISGAGHDAMIMAQITEVGLVFVPSKDGRSHCPEEWTNYEDLQKGIEVVYDTIKGMAEVLE